MRAMRKGDLAFLYHSNCKVPGIAGTMEIVQEHSPDGTYTLLELTLSLNTGHETDKTLLYRISFRP